MAASLRALGVYGPLSRLSAWWLRARGWRVEILDPLPEKCVIIMYPHTSNRDFVIGLLAKWAAGLTAKRDALCFAGKESLFAGPWSIFFRAVGGFPVDRNGSAGFVAQMTARFAGAARMRFAIAPEGTRSYVPHMRSSFYYVARAARVPIILGAFDFATKRVIVIEPFVPGDDVAADLRQIERYYQRLSNQGAIADNAAPWVFREK
jgi:1-acyl-sn-glycerol-3-phosphate acyltransferase